MTLRPALSIRPMAIGRPGRIAIRQKSDVAEAGEHHPRVVGFADAGAAGGDHRVGGVRGGAERGLERLRIVADHAEVEHLDAEALQHRPERVAVAVVDRSPGSSASPIERSSSPVEKKATRRRRNTGTSARPSEASTPMSAGRSSAAGGKRDRAARQVFAGEAPVLALANDAGGEDDARAVERARTPAARPCPARPAWSRRS